MQLDIHAATLYGLDDVLKWTLLEEDKDEIIVMDLPAKEATCFSLPSEHDVPAEENSEAFEQVDQEHCMYLAEVGTNQKTDEGRWREGPRRSRPSALSKEEKNEVAVGLAFVCLSQACFCFSQAP